MNLHDIPDTRAAVRLADVEPLDDEEVDLLMADFLKNGSVAVAHAGVERVLATILARRKKEVPA